MALQDGSLQSIGDEIDLEDVGLYTESVQLNKHIESAWCARNGTANITQTILMG